MEETNGYDDDDDDDKQILVVIWITLRYVSVRVTIRWGHCHTLHGKIMLHGVCLLVTILRYQRP